MVSWGLAQTQLHMSFLNKKKKNQEYGVRMSRRRKGPLFTYYLLIFLRP